ncbi:hypothetical protein NIES3974_10900 [Calothrix sp. NIES-3974]|nr:hypothetical protein NIES3974_10900 [Calothrix sp. NIES-3974]
MTEICQYCPFDSLISKYMKQNNQKALSFLALLLGVVAIAAIGATVIAKSRYPNPISVSSPTSTESASTNGTNVTNAGVTVSSGKFVSGEHPTQGNATIIKQGEKHLIELDQSFQTSTSGPDLFVILHRNPNVIASSTPPDYPLRQGDYLVIAPLKSYNGAQTYEIPNGTNLSDFASVAIWCRKFNATFGAASLTNVSS